MVKSNFIPQSIYACIQNENVIPILANLIDINKPMKYVDICLMNCQMINKEQQKKAGTKLFQAQFELGLAVPS